MGIPRTPKVAQEEWFRRLDELIERNPHQVFVMRDKRALRDEARRVGVELSVGDPEQVKGGLSRGMTLEAIARKHKLPLAKLQNQLAMGIKVEREHTNDPKLARRIAMDHLVEHADYYTRLKRVEKSSMLNTLEKAKKGEDVFPHKYIEKHVTPSGNVVYVYADDLRHGVRQKQTGFQEGRPGAEPVEPPGPLGAKRKRTLEGMAGTSPEAMRVVEHGLTHPADTVRATQLVLHNIYGGDMKAMQKDIQAVVSRNEHLSGLPKAEQQAYVAEAIVRSHLLARPDIEVPKPYFGADATESPEFKKWFGDSKVVDKDGKPMVVYHGTRKGDFGGRRGDFEKFDTSGSESQRVAGAYFTKDPEEASKYAKGEGANVRPVYLSLKNPAGRSVLDKLGYGPNGVEIRKKLISMGYDGLIDETMNEIVAFHPEQIKSKFDLKSPRAMTGHLKGKSSYVMHPDPNKRQPWQLTGDQYKARQTVDPELGGKTHADVVHEAHARGELIPAKVLSEHPDIKEDYLKNHPEMELSPETQKYVEKFDRLSERLPKSFDEWVHPDVKTMGDGLLTGEKASGYNVDEVEGYDVGDADVYSHMMTAPETIVMYHMYAQHADHGRRMLAILHENGIAPKYTVVRRASAVKWDNTWTEEPELAYRETGRKDAGGRPERIAYSSDYILAFLPESKEQGEAICKALNKHGNMTESDFAIPNSYYVPDVRSSQKVDDFERRYLNVKRVGTQELCVLTREDWIHKEGEAPQSKEEVKARRDEEYHPEFVRDYVWLGRKLTRKELAANAVVAERNKKLKSDGKLEEGLPHGTLAQFIKSQRLYVRI